MPKVIIIIISRSKLINIRVILNTISLNIVLRFKILITYNIKIAL
jgi:hypothetical protein